MSECYLAFTETPQTKLFFSPYLFKGTIVARLYQGHIQLNGRSEFR